GDREAGVFADADGEIAWLFADDRRPGTAVRDPVDPRLRAALQVVERAVGSELYVDGLRDHRGDAAHERLDRAAGRIDRVAAAAAVVRKEVETDVVGRKDRRRRVVEGGPDDCDAGEGAPPAVAVGVERGEEAC